MAREHAAAAKAKAEAADEAKAAANKAQFDASLGKLQAARHPDTLSIPACCSLPSLISPSLHSQAEAEVAKAQAEVEEAAEAMAKVCHGP